MKKLSLWALIIAIFLSACNKDSSSTTHTKTATGESVIVMDTSMVSLKLKEISSDGTLIFNKLTSKEMPAQGDVICSAPSKGAPQGFLYRVKDVTTTGNETTITTEFATIEEAVEEADVDQTFDLTIIEIEDEEGVEVVELPQAFTGQSRAAADVGGIKLNIDKKIDENLHIKGTIELKTKVRCVVKIGFFQLNSFLLSTQPQFKAQLAATLESKVEKEVSFPITSFKGQPVIIWVGVVPLVFTPKVTINGVLTTKGEVKLQATLVDWDYSYTIGIRYQNGKLEAISENTSKPAKYMEDVQLVLTGEMKLQPKLSYQYDLYNSGTYAGVFGDLYAKLKVTDNVGSDVKLSFSAGLEFGADAELKILSFKLGKLKLTFFSIEWPIWERLWEIKEDVVDVYLVGDNNNAYGSAILWKNGVGQYLETEDGNESLAHSVFVSGGDVYVAGQNLHSSTATLWINGVEHNLGIMGSAYSVFVSDSDVYIAGYERSSGTNWNDIAKLWKNGVEQNLGYGQAGSVFVSGNDVYVAGNLNSIPTLWKNGEMQYLGTDRGTATSVFVSGNDVYVAGYESGWLEMAKLWKNGVEQNLGYGIAGSVFVSGNDVYVAGGILYGGYGAKLWKNGVEQKLEDADNCVATSVFVSGVNVYVAGMGREDGNSEIDRAVLWKNGAIKYFTDPIDTLVHASASSVFVVKK